MFENVVMGCFNVKTVTFVPIYLVHSRLGPGGGAQGAATPHTP